MKKEKNVEEIYELLRKRNAILKTNFKRMGICGGMIPFTIANSSFGIFSIPFFYYALSIMYSACSYDFLDRYFINSLEYTEFINKFSILFEDLKYMLEGIEIKTPPKIFASYYYVVRHGFLSQDHTFMANNIPNTTAIYNTTFACDFIFLFTFVFGFATCFLVVSTFLAVLFLGYFFFTGLYSGCNFLGLVSY